MLRFDDPPPSTISLHHGNSLLPELNLRDTTTAQIYLTSPSGRPEIVTVLVVRDEIGFESYWYPVWPFFRQVGYSHKRHADQLLDSTTMRTYDELRCIYGWPPNLQLHTRYMNDDGMMTLLHQRSRVHGMNEMRQTLRETLRHFRRTRMFVTMDLVRSLTVQHMLNMMPPRGGL